MDIYIFGESTTESIGSAFTKPETEQVVEDDGACGQECAWVSPYGWVPECGCPIHDPDY